MNFWKPRNSFIMLGLLISSGNIASAEGLVFEGKKIAVKWCAECHIVSDEQNTALTDAPSFRFIASRYEASLDALGVFLADPHPVMPDLSLTRREIQDLLAYIDSLE